MRYLLSIVIPTRNRQKYAVQSVKQIYNVTDDRVQVIVQDNSDDNSLEALLSKESFDDRVKYTYIAKRIPGVDNYAGGIAASEGEYVCCIGDDDGVLRQIVKVTEWAKAHNVPVIKPGVQASYIWPATSKEFPDGCLNLEYTDSSYFNVNPQEELIPFLRSGCTDLPNALLVKAYHGIVKRELFEKIKEKTGKYCGGLSPDIYLSVSLSLNCSSLLCLNMPLTIFGACRASTTGDSINRTNVSKLEDAPHFIGQPYTWSEKVPRFYCGLNIWADSAMHALDDMGAVEQKKLYSVEKLSAECLLNYRQYKKEIMENFYRNNCDKNELKRDILGYFPSHCKAKVKNFVKGIKPVASLYRSIRDKKQEKENAEVFVKQGVSNIIEAEDIISSTISHTIDTFLENAKVDMDGVIK